MKISTPISQSFAPNPLHAKIRISCDREASFIQHLILLLVAPTILPSHISCIELFFGDLFGTHKLFFKGLKLGMRLSGSDYFSFFNTPRGFKLFLDKEIGVIHDRIITLSICHNNFIISQNSGVTPIRGFLRSHITNPLPINLHRLFKLHYGTISGSYRIQEVFINSDISLFYWIIGFFASRKRKVFAKRTGNKNSVAIFMLKNFVALGSETYH